ncbi:hypothetical protein [Pseudoxanthomonas sp. LARHCG66]
MVRTALKTKLLCAGILALCGCATARPEQPKNTASYIDYQLPVTNAQIALNLVLTSCNPVEAKAEVSIIPMVTPTPFAEHRFRVNGEDLRSYTKKQDLKIELHPVGSIKSINSSTEDRTAAIVGNVLKIVAPIVGAAGSKPTAQACNDTTKEALVRYGSLTSDISDLRKSMVGAKDPAATQKKIDAFAAEAALIRTELLSLTLTRQIELYRTVYVPPAGTPARTDTASDRPKNVGGERIRWSRQDLKKWFTVPGSDTMTADWFSIGWCLRGDDVPGNAACSAIQFDQIFDNSVPEVRTAAKISCDIADAKCPTTLVFREPVAAKLTVISLDSSLKSDLTPLAKAPMAMAQWGEVTYLPLTVGFGQARNLSLSLDEFGRRSTFGWTSNAQMEGITGGALGVVESAAALRASRESADLKSMKAEADELQMQLTLNKLRNCKAVIDAGGYNCPTE